MKCWICLLAAIMFAVTAMPVAAAEMLSPEAEVVADRLAAELPLLLSNGAYVDIFTGAWTQDFDPMVTLMAENTWQKPVSTVWLECDEAALLAAMNVTELSAEAMHSYIPDIITRLVSGSMDYETMLLSAIAANADVYTDAEATEGTQVFLRFYEDGLPVICTAEAMDGAVRVSVRPLVRFAELPEHNDAASVQVWLDSQGLSFIRASDVPAMLPASMTPVSGATEAERAAALAQVAAARMADPGFLQAMGLDALIVPTAPEAYASLRLTVLMQLDLRTQGLMAYANGLIGALRSGDEVVERRLLQGFPGDYMAAIVSLYGAPGDIVAMSGSTVQTIYADPERPDGTLVYLMIYEGGGAVAVSVTAMDGIVCMQAQQLKLKGLTECASALDVSLWMARNALPAVCTEVPIN